MHYAHRGLGVREYSLSAARAIRRAIPFDGMCLMTMDPATLLPTGHVIENGLPQEATPRLAEIEHSERDFNKFNDLARREIRAGALSQATGGRLDRSLRQRELRAPHGFDDELRVALGVGSTTWGGLVLMRERGRANFTPAETKAVATLAAELAEGLRRAILLGAPPADEPENGPGLAILDEDNSLELANAAAEYWLAELDGDLTGGDSVPIAIRAVADRARAVEAGAGGPPASARVRAASGRWLLLRGSVMGDDEDARAAVILEPARSPELAPLIADAYGLTRRERAITQLVAHGLSTDEIAERLFVSPYTVQDHLKAIFDKTDVNSRGALVARLFFEHYAPRAAAGTQLDANGWFASTDGSLA